ncbi:MAG: cytochrome P450 [Erythrobacter sp.]
MNGHDKDDAARVGCPHSLKEVDLFGPGAQEHWYAAYPILHDQAPVMRIEGEGLLPGTDAYILTMHEDINRVVRDWARFQPTMMLAVENVAKAGVPPFEVPNVNAMIASAATLRRDEASWRAHRKELTDPWVGPGATRHEEMILGHVDDLIDRWIVRDGPIDFVAEFARPLPQRTMASVLGFPLEDIPQLEAWGNAQVFAFVHGKGHRNTITSEQAKEQHRILDGFSDYVSEKTREKRANPCDDMVSFLTQVHYSPIDRKLTDEEVNGVVYAMLIGGLETTQYAIAEQAQLLCENPSIFTRLMDDPSRIRVFVEEGMRLRSPTQGLSTRVTTQDEVFQGVEVPAGSLLHMRFAAANIDPKAFDDANDLKLERKAPTRHLAFSAGLRSCPGATLSRVEQMIAWRRLCERFEAVSFAEGNDFLHQPGIMLGLNQLHLHFKPATGAA